MLRRGIASGAGVPPRSLAWSSPLRNGLLRTPKQSFSVSTHLRTPVEVRRPGIFRRAWNMFKLGTGFTIAASVGYAGILLYTMRNPPDQLPIDHSKKRLVILGTGWASVSLLKSLDTSNFDVTIVSPRNYFLFTPLLPSCSTGMVEHRSIMEPVRAIMRSKQAESSFVEGEVTHIDHVNRKVTVTGKPANNGDTGLPEQTTEIPFDYLVIGVGSEVSTYGIPGVKEHGIFMKEIEHAQRARQRMMDCIESASFPGQDSATRKRLLHAVVVGGGPTGVEFAGELHDFFEEDLRKYNPSLEADFKVTLVEALPNVLPSFSKHLINFTEQTLKDEKIDVLTKTAVKDVTDEKIIAEQTLPDGSKKRIELPYGLFVWAGGNMVRQVIKDLIAAVPEQAGSRRGLLIDEYLAVKGCNGIWALGDCTSSAYAPTAQVAAQEGMYLGSLLNRLAQVSEIDNRAADIEEALGNKRDSMAENEIRSLDRKRRRFGTQKTFQYSHQGSLAYVGSDKAVADLQVWGSTELASAGSLTYLFWRSAYLSMAFSFRNKMLVATDWIKVKIFGRDVSRE